MKDKITTGYYLTNKIPQIHIVYAAIIAGILFLNSSMNVVEDKMRTEIVCKDFIIDILKEK